MSQENLSGTTYKWDVMISYCWVQRDQALKIKQKLEEKGFRIWYDKEQIAKFPSISEALEDGIFHSAAVLLCISSDYGLSSRCEQEVDFLFKVPKPRFWVKVSKYYERKPDWLKLSIGKSDYFDMSSAEKQEKYFPKLEAALCNVVTPRNLLESYSSDEENNDIPATDGGFRCTTIKTVAECNDIELNIFKLASLQNYLYTCSKNNHHSQIDVFQLSGTEFVKLDSKKVLGQISYLTSNGSSLYAVIENSKENSFEDPLKQGLYELDPESLEVVKTFDTSRVSNFGRWRISSFGKKLVLLANNKMKAQVVHEFVENKRKRKMYLPRDSFAYSIKLANSETLLSWNVFYVECFRLPKTSKEISELLWKLEGRSSLFPSLELCRGHFLLGSFCELGKEKFSLNFSDITQKVPKFVKVKKSDDIVACVTINDKFILSVNLSTCKYLLMELC